MSESVSMTGGAAARQRRRLVMAVAAATVAAACTTAAAPDSGDQAAPGMAHMPGMAHAHDMPDMASAPATPAVAEAEPGGAGLSAAMGGYSFAAEPTAPDTFTFRIIGPGGRTVTRYQPYESRLVVLYVVRADLSVFQLLDPAMREDGRWTARLPALPPGSYRAFVTFAAPDAGEGVPLRYTLSQPFTVDGQPQDTPLPAPATTATADGFTVTWTGQPGAGVSAPLAVSIVNGGKPVQHVDRFLDGYVHLTAFRAGDLAFARFLATGKDNAGLLTANAMFPGGGTWRLFAQFQVDGQAHTAAFTIVVPAR